MNKYSSRIWNKLEHLIERDIYQRDYLFCLVGVVVSLLVYYMLMRPEGYTETWLDVAVVLLSVGAFYGFYYWFDILYGHDLGKVRRVSLEIEGIIADIEKQSYAEGYRDGVSAANADSVDPEFM